MKCTVMTMLIGALLFGAGTIETVDAAMIINDPNQLVDFTYSQDISMAIGDNLMEKVGGTEFVFDKLAGEAYVLLGEETSNVVDWVGWFGTNNDSSDNGGAGSKARCKGYIDRNLLPAGTVPNYELGFYDDDGGQFALLYSSGILVFDANVEFFPGIEYDGVIGGLTSIAIGSEVKRTVIVPEPATLALLAIGGLAVLRRRRRM